ncbi:MAG TPA: glucoamylase family protein [Gemmataceae bacterium]|nr:glucoamylase family protein [Gemmataceae bacterium]
MNRADPCDPTDEPFLSEADAPFRSQVLGYDHLDDLARTVAARWPAAVRPGAHSLLRRLRDNERVLHEARAEAAAAADAKEPLTPDAEWLLDNFFVIEEVLREVRKDLPRGYYDELPVVTTGPWGGLPRIYALAVALITHTDSHLEDGSILRFVKSFQEVAPLTTGELWAVPTMLRLALLENLRRLAAQMLAARVERQLATTWVSRAAGSPVPPPLPERPSDTFLVAWHKALRDRESDIPVGPLHDWLARHSDDLTEVLCREHRRQAANQVSVGNCVTSLRLLNAIEWPVFFERASKVEEVLRGEPTGVYARQEFATRDRYRQAVEQLAKSSKRDEVEVAKRAVARAMEGEGRAGHVGYYLIDDGKRAFAAELGCRFKLRDRWRAFHTDHPYLIHFGGVATTTIALVVLAVGLSWPVLGWWALLVALAVLMPATELAVGIVNYCVCRVLPPRVLPKLDFTTGVPDGWPTVVVIPGMLFRPSSAVHLSERLELHYLANPDPMLRFALLTDWADAPNEHMPEDDALVEAAIEAIRQLNERHAPAGPPKFFLFHRRRQFNSGEHSWMGWERKRGKLEEFNALLRGAKDTSYVVQTGDIAEFQARFVLTLDADTVLPRDAARRLIATLAHPLNRPVLTPDGRRVAAGYAVLQPRVSFLYRTGMRSLFARVFAGSAGIDPYSSASSDVYQDLFGWGTFTGKGLYDVDAFMTTAGRAFPDNHILSHDLIESNFGRCALVTDIEVFDDFPAKYHAYARREHRWIRGDWQLLPWLGPKAPTPEGPKPNAVNALGRWKVLDNLRRSLIPPALIVLLALGWTVLPGPGWVWSLAALAVLALPLGLQLFDGLRGLITGAPAGTVIRQSRMNLGATAAQVALSGVFLANQAVIALDAVGRTLYRLFVTRKHLLEWEAAAAAEARLGGGLLSFVVSMWMAVALSVGLAGLLLWVTPAALPAAAPWLAAWVLSPVIAYWVSRPLPDRDPPLSVADRMELRRTARKTWRFFETFVTDEDHWLPPDNYQEDPKGEIAHRTSPTNMGLLALSTLSAHDLGYLTLPVLASRLGKTFDTFDLLEKYRGHFLNWYETSNLKVLPPGYVSTVDSGNLLACLLVLKNGLAEKVLEPIPGPAAVDGLIDTLDLAADQLPKGSVDALRAHLATPPGDLLGWDMWLAKAQELAAALPSGPEVWTEAVVLHVRAMREELSTVCPWVKVLNGRHALSNLPSRNGEAGSAHPDDSWSALLRQLNTPTGVELWAETIPELLSELAGWAKGKPASGHEAEAEALAEALARSTAKDLAIAVDNLARRATAFADAMDFGFLYSQSRNLFAIGYNVPLERLDPAHYDLLASEAAIASFLAVARGVVPRKHWFQLGRLATRVAGMPGLVSWGGTMFEYLMPRILLPAPPGTLLDTAQRAAVARQIEYGRQQHIPWGISESGFYVIDANSLDYQYQSFGVPGLGLKRGLSKDLVVAPYATMLAVPVDTHAAVANFATLRACGGEGPYGFYEALDFTPDRLEKGDRCKAVKEYMAHHQGMGLCAITNRLKGDVHPRRLRAEPAVRAVELLLHERVPIDAPELRDPEEHTEGAGAPASDAVNRRLTRADTPAPRPHLLSNGHYTVMVTNAGAGYSTCRGLAVSRWRWDPTSDGYGTFLYVRDVATGRAWSAGHQPLRAPADTYEVIYSADKAELRRRDGPIETLLEITVAPDRDVEVRRLTLVNHDREPHTLEVTSYVEVVLNDHRADLAHPAFGKLFLETEWLPQWHALLCRRRPRAADQKPMFAVHSVSTDADTAGPAEYETDRAKFLGRRRTPGNPRALNRPLSGTVGAVLDPVFALRRTVTLSPGTTATLSFATAVADSRDAALAVADHYHSPTATARAFELAWANSRVELNDLDISPATSHVFQRLAGHVLFPPAALRATPAILANRQGQSALWRYGISGDLPILLVCISEGDGLPLARQALQAHGFWRGRGFPVDLVLLADRPASYREELYDALGAQARASDSRDLIDRPGGVFVRRAGQLGDDRGLLLAAARVVLYGDRGSLADQTDALARSRPQPPKFTPTLPAVPAGPGSTHAGEMRFANSTGGFTPDGREYVIVGVPPAPWTNVIANPQAGCLATDAGLGYTWVGNSQANRLTPWSNDPVSDPPGEAVYLRDEETGMIWSPTPLPAGADAPTIVRHGAGYTTYVQERNRLATELTVFVPCSDPVKVLKLRVANRGGRPRRLSAAFYAEWVLGTTRDQTAPFVVTELDPESGALLARNAFNAEFGSAVAFADTSLRPRTVTGDRQEFIGRNRSSADPAAFTRTGLSGATGAALDPCAGLHGRFEVPPGGEAIVIFVLGQAADRGTAARLAAQYRRPEAAQTARREATDAWDRRLGVVTVKTPDPALDAIANRWLPYQVLSCRVWGRSAFYQSGGAYGFRDQLQDVLALLYAEPAEARAHLLRAASRQFLEGDVQHWWHPPTGRGVRTRFSDDFLWLPFAVARYVEVTGDTGVLDEQVPYLRGPALKEGEHESYFLPDVTAETDPLFVHCLRALDRGWALGAHGIPLMGCGDWNDGMNLVGAGGKGESVWVGWFQIAVRSRFADLAERRGDADLAGRLRSQADQLHKAIEEHAWDGDWYLRAWFDDGTPLGSKQSDECQIDSLPQSWAVLSGVGELGRTKKAVDAAMNLLVNRGSGLIKLFTPPFDRGSLQPGYIKGYVPGIRENGGQYTHAAVWLVQALAGLGKGGDAHTLWRLLNPLAHAATPDDVRRYRVEPYVVAADVYGVEPHVGRGGWTWYTGSASWLYRAALETLLGFDKRGGLLQFDPRIPAAWPGFEVDYRHGRTLYRCRVENPSGVERGVKEVWLDGRRSPDRTIRLADDGRDHEVRVVLG